MTGHDITAPSARVWPSSHGRCVWLGVRSLSQEAGSFLQQFRVLFVTCVTDSETALRWESSSACNLRGTPSSRGSGFRLRPRRVHQCRGSWVESSPL